jgi:hypothetical protein
MLTSTPDHSALTVDSSSTYYDDYNDIEKDAIDKGIEKIPIPSNFFKIILTFYVKIK